MNRVRDVSQGISYFYAQKGMKKMTNEQTKKIFKRIGERIQHICKMDDITIEELSERTEIPLIRLRKWEIGDSMKCPATDMYLIAKALEVDMEYLFFSEMEKSVENFFLAYKLSTLPEHIQKQLLERFDKASSAKEYSAEFWNDIISMMADGNGELLQKFKKRLLELADEMES